MNRRSRQLTSAPLVVWGGFLLLLNCPGRGLEDYSADFLDSLGFTQQIREKIINRTLTEAESDELRAGFETKGLVIWQNLWHPEFNKPLQRADGQPFDLSDYDLSIERADEGLSAEARDVVAKLSFVALCSSRTIVTLLKAKEQDSLSTPTIGDKIIYSILNRLLEETQPEWPSLEDWGQFSTSENPIYRLIALNAASHAVPQELGRASRSVVAGGEKRVDANIQAILDAAYLRYVTPFLNDANNYIRKEAARDLAASRYAINPPEVQQRLRDILGDELDELLPD